MEIRSGKLWVEEGLGGGNQKTVRRENRVGVRLSYQNL